MARETPKKPEIVELPPSNLCVTCDTIISLGRPSSRRRLYKPVSDWLEMLPLDSTRLNM